MDGVEARRGSAADDGELRLVDLWRIISEGWFVILVCAAIGLAVAIVLALSMDNIYRGQVVLAPSAEEGPGGSPAGALADVAMIAGIQMPGKAGVSKADEAIAVMRSRRFTENFIRRERILAILLPEVDEAPGLIRRMTTGIQGMFGRSNSYGENNAMERAQVDQNPRVIWDAYKVFNEIRQVNVDKEIGLVTVVVDWTDPVLAAEWANKIVAYINRESRAREIEAAEKNIAYLQQQVDITVETDRRRLLFNLIEGETRRIMLANSRDEFAFRIIDPAIVPQEKARPQRAMMATGGLMGGLVLGILIVVIRHAVRNSENAVA